jgi:hypothetical protein
MQREPWVVVDTLGDIVDRAEGIFVTLHNKRLLTLHNKEKFRLFVPQNQLFSNFVIH